MDKETQVKQQTEEVTAAALYKELLQSPSIASLLVHPGFQKYQEYLKKLRALYDYFLVRRSNDERSDCFLKGKIQILEELAVLDEQIKKDMKKEQEGGR